MSTFYLGVDVSKATLDVALYDGKRYHTASFDNQADGFRRLFKWLKKHNARGCAICLEATGRYGDAFAMAAHERGYRVSVVNPVRVKAYATSQMRRNKTDREDAKTLAHFCATQSPQQWQPPSESERELQALTRQLDALKDARQRERNRLQSGITSAAVRASLEAHLAFLDAQIDELQQLIEAHIAQDADLKSKHDLIVSIIGIGSLTAALFLAEVPDITRFDSAAQLAAYAGLTPRQHQSGSSVYKPARLSKRGNRRLRSALFMPAFAAIRFNPLIQTFVQRLEQRGKRRIVIVSAVMRKLLHIIYGVLKNNTGFDPDYLVNSSATA